MVPEVATIEKVAQPPKRWAENAPGIAAVQPAMRFPTVFPPRPWGLTLAGLLIAGCASAPYVPPDAPETGVQAQERRSQATRPAYNLAGYPPAVREGYIDGCESAKQSPYARKDAARFGADRQYAMGWNDGFMICGKQ